MSDLNDPRVFFAAERTLMAWNRTGLTLMTFGFMLERFGLFLHMEHLSPTSGGRDYSFWIGVAFISLALTGMALSIVQFRRVLRSLKPVEIPDGYCVWCGVGTNLSVIVLGIALLGYLFSEF